MAVCLSSTTLLPQPYLMSSYGPWSMRRVEKVTFIDLLFYLFTLFEESKLLICEGILPTSYKQLSSEHIKE